MVVSKRFSKRKPDHFTPWGHEERGGWGMFPDHAPFGIGKVVLLLRATQGAIERLMRLYKVFVFCQHPILIAWRACRRPWSYSSSAVSKMSCFTIQNGFNRRTESPRGWLCLSWENPRQKLTRLAERVSVSVACIIMPNPSESDNTFCGSHSQWQQNWVHSDHHPRIPW